MRQPRDQHWTDLLEALEMEADALAAELDGDAEHACGVLARQ